ncbi:hypothetical protein Hanom_Chr15g01378351 [Helianthus anomalus]
MMLRLPEFIRISFQESYYSCLFSIAYIAMVPGFVKVIHDASSSYLPMPPFYNNGDGYVGYPVGHVTLIIGSHVWHVYVKVTISG